MKGQRWWLVGASEGLGHALAGLMTHEGAEVVVSARNAERLNAMVADGIAARAVVMDVTDEHSVAAAAAALGEIDGIIWLSAVYWPMRAQEFDAARAVQMVDTNLAGLMRVLGLVLPGFVARRRGRIVLVGSLSGYRGLPGAIGYAASKAGVMHLAEDLHADLRGSGVVLQLAIPGFIRTRLTAMNDFKMPQLMEPEAAADEIMKLIASRKFSRAFPRPFAWIFRLGNFLPDWLYYRLFAPIRK